jgi:hypothetical protein
MKELQSLAAHLRDLSARVDSIGQLLVSSMAPLLDVLPVVLVSPVVEVDSLAPPLMLLLRSVLAAPPVLVPVSDPVLEASPLLSASKPDPHAPHSASATVVAWDGAFMAARSSTTWTFPTPCKRSPFATSPRRTS